MKISFITRFYLVILLVSFFILNTSCSSIISSASRKMADNLSQTILNSDDLKTVADGAPAYLLLIDSFLLDSPDNKGLLQSASTLYGAYASVFVTDPLRAKKMSTKSFSYAEQALCLSDQNFCHIRKLKFKLFTPIMHEINTQNLHDWFIFASAWAAWIKSHSDNISAIIDLPKVQLIMERINEIDDSYENGTVQLYLAVLKTLIPPALGGKPNKAQKHFKHAINISDGKNLMFKVLYAKKYARLVFNQQLHDHLLNEVLDADPYQADLVLMNILAQQKASILLNSSPDYFE